MKAKELYDQTLKELMVGDVVSFKKINSFFKIRGEVKALFSIADVCYLRIYSFFFRKEILYIINENLELVLPEKYPDTNDPNALIIYEDFNPDEALKPQNTLKLSFSKIILMIIIVSLVLTINPYIKISFTPTDFTYEAFLGKTLSLNKLYDTVTARLYYSYDVGENWQTPKDAWNLKTGDCEDFAVIFADYLTRHQIENYLVGLNIKNSAEGHAVVYTKMDNFYYILDPTRAVEPLGIKKLLKINTLKEAVALYSSLPVPVFKIPSFPNDKQVFLVVY